MFNFYFANVNAVVLWQDPTEVVYLVNEANNGTNAWYYDGYSKNISYGISVGSYVNLTIHNMEKSIISLVIGNLTRQNIEDIETEDNLILGYYPMLGKFGFIVNNSWGEVNSEFEGLELNQSSFKTNLIDSYLGNNIEIVVVSFDVGDQQTVLIYEKDHGLLLFARTTFWGYLLEIEIQSIDGDTSYFTSQTTEVSPFGFIIISMGLLLGIMVIKKNIK